MPSSQAQGSSAQRPSSSSASLSTSPSSPLTAVSLSTSTATTSMHAVGGTSNSASTTTSTSASAPAAPTPLHQTLPSTEAQSHVAEARAAVVASLGNMLDSQLQSRAEILHANAAALDRQERNLVAATEALRREREKLAREADGAARRLKEVGNVQNWAEVLERGFLTLEETLRLANRRGRGLCSGDGSDHGDGDDGGADEDARSCSCSCSECGGRCSEDEDEDEVDDGRGKMEAQHTKGKLAAGEQGLENASVVAGSDAGLGHWSDASRSLIEPGSSTCTERAKGSETASVSTDS